MLKTLDRYVIKSVLGPALLGFIVYTLIFVVNQAVELAEIAVKRDVPAALIGKLVLLSLPHIVVLTLPMSFLLGILLAFSRMSADSEIIAFRALGLSYTRLLKPVLTLALVFTGLGLLMTLYLMPWGNTALVSLRMQIFQAGLAKSLEPRVFFEGVSNMVIYVDQSDPSDPYAHRIFLYEDEPGGKAKRVTFAERARFSVVKESQALVLELENSETHAVNPADPRTYELSLHESQILVPRTESLLPEEAGSISHVRGTRELSLPELRENLRRLPQEKLPSIIREQRGRDLRVAIHKIFAIPATCLIFAILGIPLGVSNSRGGKLSGFVISVGIFVGYWVFLWGGENLAVKGAVSPFWAMWAGNAFFGITGLLLLQAHSQYRPLKLLIWPIRTAARLMEAVKNLRPFRKGPAAADSEGAVSLEVPALQRLVAEAPQRRDRPRVLKLLDRYILALFVKMYLLIVVSFLALFLIIEAVQILDDLASSGAGMRPFFGYLYYSTPRFLSWTIPLATLLANLLVLSLLGRTHELTAMQSAGLNPLRIARILIIASFLLSGALFWVQEGVLPTASRQAEQLKDVLRGRPPRTYMRADRQWMFGENHRLYNYALYNADIHRMHGVQVFTLDPVSFRVRERIYATAADWNEERGAWIFRKGWVREFPEDGSERFEEFTERSFVFPETPAYFVRERWRSPDSMNVAQLRRYISESRRSGYQTRFLEVNMQRKFSFAFLPLVLSFVGLPLAMRLSRRGPMVGFAAGIAMALVYYALFIFSSSLGTLGVLPPFLAAWAPVMLFLGLGMYLYWLILI